MDAREAELICDSGKEAVVKMLLDMDAKMKALEKQAPVRAAKIASLLTDSTNFSKPAPSNGSRVVRPRRKKSSRSPGGQKGHKRDLFSVEEVDHIHDHFLPCARNALLPSVVKPVRKPRLP
jgi:hypothetical protein